MNKMFKVVWSKVRNCYVVVSEIAKNTVSGVGKRNRIGKVSLAATLAAVALTGGFFMPNEAWAAESALINANYYNYIAIAATWDNDGNLVNPFGTGTQIDYENGVRYIDVNVDGKVLKYVYTNVDQDGAFDNDTSDDKAYWIRDGFGVKAIQDKYHIHASNVKLDLFKVPGTNATYDNISMSGAHTAEITSNKTAINNVALDKFVFRQYAAMTNAGGITTPSEWNYYINREGTNSENDYVDVGGDNFRYNFYEFKSTEYNAITGKYTFKGHDVEYENVYKVGGKIGVFLTGYAPNASTATSSYRLPEDVDVYGGVVYGKNNEILLSGYDSEANTWSTVWAGEITDPYATIDSMTLSEFNEILHHLHKEDVKLADADVVGIKAIEVTSNKEGSLRLINKANNFANGLTVKSLGGTNGNDTQLTFTGEGTYIDANGAPQSYNNSFTLNTGSKVVANDGVAYSTNQTLNTLSINGNVYRIAGGSSTGTTNVTNITLSEGDNIDIVGTTTGGVTNYKITANDTDTTYTVSTGIRDTSTGNTTYTLKDGNNNSVGYIIDTNTDTNTLYAFDDGVKDNVTGKTTYTFTGDNGYSDQIIDTNNYVSSATVVGNNLVLERVGLDNITVSLAALKDGLATTDAKLIPNPDNSSNGTYAVDANGNITLKVSDGTNTSDVVININNAKSEVKGSGNVSVDTSTGFDGHTIYTVSATDNNTTYEVNEVTTNLEAGQKTKYEIKDKVAGSVIGTIIDNDATLLNKVAEKESNNGTNTYTIKDTAGNWTKIDDVASATKLQEVITNVSNILDGTSLKLGVDSTNKGIALFKENGSVHSYIGVTSSNIDTNSNDATLTFTDAANKSFSVNVGSVVRASFTTNNANENVLNGININGTPYKIKDTILDEGKSASAKQEIKDDSGTTKIGYNYVVWDSSGNDVPISDVASADYVEKLAGIVDGKTSRDVIVEQVNNNIKVTHSEDANHDFTYHIKLGDELHIANSIEVGDKVDIYGSTGRILTETVEANTSISVKNVVVTSSYITGLSNRYWDPDGTYTSGRAATEEQLQQAIEHVQSGSVAGDNFVVSGVANSASKTGKIILDMKNTADIEIDGLEDYALDSQHVNVADTGVATLRVTDRYDASKYHYVTINDIAKASDVGDINTITVGGNGGTTNPTTIVNHINNLYSQVNTISATNSDWRLVGAYDSTVTDPYGYDNKYEVDDDNTITLNMQDKNSTGSQVKQVVIENVAKASDVGVISDINHSLATGTDNNVVNHINNLYTQVSAEAAKDTIVENGDANIVVSQPISRGDDTVYQVSLASNVYVNNSITVGTGTSKVILDGTNASVSAHNVTATTIEAKGNFKVGDTYMSNGAVYGLNNTTWDSTAQYTGGRAATQEQLQEAINYVKGNLDSQISNVAGEKIIDGINNYDGTITLKKNNGGTAEITGIENHALVAHASKADAIKADSEGIVELVTIDKYNSNSKHSTYIADVASKEKLDNLTGAVGVNNKETVKESYKDTTFLKETETLTEADVKLDKAVTENRQVVIGNYQNIQMLQRNDQYLDSRINQVNSRVNKVGAGAAALAALHPMDFDPDDKLSFAVGAGNYAGVL